MKPILAAVALFWISQAHATMNARHASACNSNSLPRLYATKIRGGAKASTPSSAPSTKPDVSALARKAAGFFRDVFSSSSTKTTTTTSSTGSSRPLPLGMTSATDLLLAAQKFALQILDDASQRRNVYAENPEIQRTASVVIQPIRLLKILLSSFLMSEGYWLAVDKTQSIYHGVLEPKMYLVEGQLKTWWERGRSDQGLFRVDTWKDPRVLSAAWNQQFSAKHQWMIGVAAGMILSPVSWSIGGAVVKTLGSLYVLAESNNIAKERVDRWAKVATNTWQKVDSILDKLRLLVRDAVQHPADLLFAVKDQMKKGTLHRFVLPPSLQQGLLLGLIVGWWIVARSNCWMVDWCITKRLFGD